MLGTWRKHYKSSETKPFALFIKFIEFPGVKFTFLSKIIMWSDC